MSRRILLVEDEPGLVLTLTDRLMAEGYDVESEGDAVRGLSRGSTGTFDVILLDVMLPGGSGFDVCRTLRQRGVQTPILMLTARGQVVDRVVGLKLGADDYLVKPFSLNELQARVRALLRRGQQGGAAPTVLYGGLEFDTVRRLASIQGRTLLLSAHESGVLEVLLHRFGRVVSKEQILHRRCEWSEEVSNNAIEEYVHRLRRKLEAAGVEIVTTRGIGYRIQKAG